MRKTILMVTVLLLLFCVGFGLVSAQLDIKDIGGKDIKPIETVVEDTPSYSMRQSIFGGVNVERVETQDEFTPTKEYFNGSTFCYELEVGVFDQQALVISGKDVTKIPVKDYRKFDYELQSLDIFNEEKKVLEKQDVMVAIGYKTKYIDITQPVKDCFDITQPGEYHIGTTSTVYNVTAFGYGSDSGTSTHTEGVVLAEPDGIPTDDLLARYSFTDDATDSINSYDGTVTGTTHNYTGYYEFDTGIDRRIDFTGPSDSVIGNFTISIWFNDKGNTDSGNSNTLLFTFDDAGANSFACYILDSTNMLQCPLYQQDYLTQHVITENQWNHFVITGKQNNTHYINYTFYVNNVIINTTTKASLITRSTETFSLGGEAQWNSWNGSMDEILIYNKSLSSTEVTQIYNAGRYRQSPEVGNYTGGLLDIQSLPQATLLDNMSGLLGRWSMTYAAEDTSGNSNDGTVTGATHQNEGFYKCDGVNDNIVFSLINSMTITNPNSVSAWFNLNNLDERQTIINHQHNVSQRITCIVWDSDNRLRCAFYNGTTNTQVASSDNALVQNQWYHMSYTFNTTLNLYIDNVKQTRTAIPSHGGGSGFKIGSLAQDAWYFNGSIDEVSIWNRSLTATEITRLFDTGRSSNATEAHWLELQGKCIEPTGTNCTARGRAGDIAKPDVTDTDLVAYWPMTAEYCNSTHILEYTGNYHAELKNGMKCGSVPGVFQNENATQSRYISNHYATFPDLTVRNATVCFWAKIRSFKEVNSQTMIVLSKEGPWQEAASIGNNSNRIRLIWEENDGSTVITTSSSSYTPDYINESKFFHACIIRQDGNLTSFLNGNFYDTTLDANLNDSTSFNDISTTSSRAMDGVLAHVSVWNRSISQDEILNWSTWTGYELLNDGVNLSQLPLSRYLQYEVQLSSDNLSETPVLDWVGADFNTAPTIDSITVTGNTRNNTYTDWIGSWSESDDDGNYLQNFTWFNTSTKQLILGMDFDVDATEHTGISGDGVVSGATHYEDGGVNSTGAYLFDGTNDLITISHNTDLQLNDDWSIAYWYKNVSEVGSWPGVLDKGNWKDANGDGWGIYMSSSDDGFQMIIDNQELGAGSNTISSEWNHYIITYDGSNAKWYVNGVLSSTIASTFDTNTNTDDLFIGRSPDGNYGNFYLDDLRIYNYSLSTRQINNLMNNGNYLNGSDTTTNETWTFNVVINDKDDYSSVSRKTFDIEDTAEPHAITINFSNSIGTINDKFYGANTHGTWGRENVSVDTTGDGATDANSNYTWHREKMLEGGITYIRGDMGLQSKYTSGLTNKNVENWGMTTYNFVTNDIVIPNGWTVESAGGGDGVISQSTDAHSGLYSVNLSEDAGGNALFHKVEVGRLPSGSTYNISVWMKTTDTINFHLQRMDTWATCCQDQSTGSGAWEYLTCECAALPDVTEGWRIILENGPNEEFLWDDINFLKDGVNYNGEIGFADNLNTTYRDMQAWADTNNITVLWIASYMPIALQNVTADCISDNNDCSANNNTAFGELVVDFIDAITNDGTYDNIEIELWNEPDLAQFWLADLSVTDTKRVDLYNNLYNATYDAVKASYPNINVGAGGLSSVTSTGGKMFMNGILSNFSNALDFFSFHDYKADTEVDFGDEFGDEVDTVETACSGFSMQCPRIVFDEYNIRHSPAAEQNQSEQRVQVGLVYSYALNKYPDNMSLAIYQWSETYPYSTGAGTYPEYPHRWTMVSEPDVDDFLFASYNITKEFSTYHPTGGTVATTTITDTHSNMVATNKYNNYYFTIINHFSDGAINATVNITGVNFSGVKNVDTGTIYTVTDGVAVVGLVHDQEVNHYTLNTKPSIIGATHNGPKNPGQVVTYTFNVTDTYDVLDNYVFSWDVAHAGYVNDSSVNLNAQEEDIIVSKTLAGVIPGDRVCALLFVYDDYGYETISDELCFDVSGSAPEGAGGGGAGGEYVTTDDLNPGLNTTQNVTVTFEDLYGDGTGTGTTTGVSCDISHLGDCFYPKNPMLGWLVIILLTYALLVLSRKGPVFVLMIVLLAGYAMTNSDFTTPTTVYNEMVCEDIHYALNVGYCMLPGKPVLGWLIVISIVLVACNFIASNLQKDKKPPSKKKQF